MGAPAVTDLRCAAALILLLLPGVARADRVVVDGGVLLGGEHGTARLDADLLLGSRIDVRMSGESSRIEARFRLRGRTRFDLVNKGTPAATRVSQLGVRLTAGAAQIDLGRTFLAVGGWRLVDGVQALGRPASGVQIGGWFGLLPDPWTTAPSPDRLGGGPMLLLHRGPLRLGVAAEVAGTLSRLPGGTGTPGLDRVSVLVKAVVEPVPPLHLSARIDLQAHPGTTAVSIADAGVDVRWRFAPAWDLRAGWAVFSSLAYLRSRERDGALGRYAARLAGLTGTVDPLAEVLDAVHHQSVVLRVRRRPAGDGLGLEFEGRYRHHPTAANRWVRAGGRIGGYRLGPLEVEGQAAFVWSDSRPRLEGGGRVGLEFDPRVFVELLVLGLADLSGAADPVHGAIAELYGTVELGRSVLLSIGYDLQVDRDHQLGAARVGVAHAAFVRARLSIDPRGTQ
jgi:hypothetical protein